MPKLVKEITSGQENSRSVDGGQLADVSVRTWRVILQSPAEAYDVQKEVGVYIGDAHPVNTELPCVSISEKSEGDSRVVRIVTATYRTTPGADPGNDPNKQPPDIRPAQYSITSSLMEVPATSWRKVGQVFVPGFRPGVFGNGFAMGGFEDGLEDPKPPVNPTGTRYDGVSTLVPIISINIEQFDNYPTRRLGDSGKVNSDEFTFLGLQIKKYTCMLRNISVRPVVESHGTAIYRGFQRNYEFAIKTNGGWLIEQLVEGFDIINNGLGQAGVDQGALNLEHDDGVIKGWPNDLELAADTQGKKMRARVLISAPNGKAMQRPSAQPIALNLDGTPRDVQNPPNGEAPILTERYLTQDAIPFGPNFVNMGVRIFDIV
jgi:hypothetical protein